jgi:hypothetical protein
MEERGKKKGMKRIKGKMLAVGGNRLSNPNIGTCAKNNHKKLINEKR